MKPHAYLDRPSHERLLRRRSGGNGIRGPGERHEESVPLSVDLDAVVDVKSLPQQPAVLVQRRRILVAELVQELRRAFHVSEEERDDTHGKARIHEAIMANIAHCVYGPGARNAVARWNESGTQRWRLTAIDRTTVTPEVASSSERRVSS